ncbi:MAG: hypothetical protein ACM34K_18315 [Bacillota bacterium]
MFIWKSELEKLLRITQKNLSSTSAVPILENYLFIEKENQLIVRTCNMVSSTTTKCEIKNGENREYCVPSQIYELMKLLPEAKLNLQFKSNGKLKISLESDPKGKYNQNYYEYSVLLGEEFPDDIEIEKAEFEISMPAKKLLEGINNVEIAAAKSKEDVRGFDTIYYELIDDQLTLTATDGILLSTTNIEEKYPAEMIKAIIPRMSNDVIKSILSETNNIEEVKIRFGKKTVEVETRLVTFRTLKSAKESYPDYRKVIPKLGDISFTINRQQLIKTLTRLSKVNSENKIYLSLKSDLTGGSVKITGYETGEENIDCRLEGTDKFDFYVDVEKFRAMINNYTSEDVTIHLSEAHKPIIIKDNHLMLLMPCRGDNK